MRPAGDWQKKIPESQRLADSPTFDRGETAVTAVPPLLCLPLKHPLVFSILHHGVRKENADAAGLLGQY